VRVTSGGHIIYQDVTDVDGIAFTSTKYGGGWNDDLGATMTEMEMRTAFIEYQNGYKATLIQFPRLGDGWGETRIAVVVMPRVLYPKYSYEPGYYYTKDFVNRLLFSVANRPPPGTRKKRHDKDQPSFWPSEGEGGE